jgi:hypothetical protein
MAGIIIYIPPIIPPPPINPTTEIMPVNNAGSFVDSNIKNIVNDYLQTESTITLDPKGLILDFVNNLYKLGDPFGLNINLDTQNNIININGADLGNLTLVADKTLPITIDGTQYYIQLYVEPPII